MVCGKHDVNALCSSVRIDERFEKRRGVPNQENMLAFSVILKSEPVDQCFPTATMLSFKTEARVTVTLTLISVSENGIV